MQKSQKLEDFGEAEANSEKTQRNLGGTPLFRVGSKKIKNSRFFGAAAYRPAVRRDACCGLSGLTGSGIAEACD